MCWFVLYSTFLKYLNGLYLWRRLLLYVSPERSPGWRFTARRHNINADISRFGLFRAYVVLFSENVWCDALSYCRLPYVIVQKLLLIVKFDMVVIIDKTIMRKLKFYRSQLAENVVDEWVLFFRKNTSRTTKHFFSSCLLLYVSPERSLGWRLTARRHCDFIGASW